MKHKTVIDQAMLFENLREHGALFLEFSDNFKTATEESVHDAAICIALLGDKF